MLHIGHQREELDIELEGKKLTQGDSFVYLGGAVCGDGKTEREHRPERKRGEQFVRGGDGGPADLKKAQHWQLGRVMSTCVTPACLYGTETLAMTELQQQRLQVCENNWVRKIARVTMDRQAKNGGVKGRGRQSYVSRAGGDEGGQG